MDQQERNKFIREHFVKGMLLKNDDVCDSIEWKDGKAVITRRVGMKCDCCLNIFASDQLNAHKANLIVLESGKLEEGKVIVCDKCVDELGYRIKKAIKNTNIIGDTLDYNTVSLKLSAAIKEEFCE